MCSGREEKKKTILTGGHLPAYEHKPAKHLTGEIITLTLSFVVFES